MAAFDFRYFAFVLALLSFRVIDAKPSLESSGDPINIDAQTNNTAAPPPKAGQSFGDWIDTLFAPTTVVSARDELDAQSAEPQLTPEGKRFKRSYSYDHGVGTSKWANETANEAYEIRVDFSGCETGLDFGTDVGVYTHTDGRTTNSTTLQDLTKDMYTLHTSTVDYRTRRHIVNTRYANHTEVLAAFAMAEANKALLGFLCLNETAALASDSGYNISETPLLSTVGPAKIPNQNVSYVAVIGSSPEVQGNITAAGTATGFSAAHDVDVTETNVNFTGSHMDTITLNLIQTGVVMAFSFLLVGIALRMRGVRRLINPAAFANQPQVGSAASAARRLQSTPGDSDPTALLSSLAPGGQEALEMNVFIAWFRRNVQQIVGGAVQEVQTSATGDVASCVTIEKALQVAADLQNLVLPDLELEPYDQLVNSLQKAHPAGGECGV